MTLSVVTRGDGPAVLWLHGYTMSSAIWPELWDRLPGWRHVGVDLPGHGDSPPLQPGTTAPSVAADLAAVAGDVGATRVVALSFGTLLAMQLAIDFAPAVSRLVLAAPAVGGSPSEPGTDDRYRELAVLRYRGAPAGLLADRWMQSPPDIFRGTEAHPALRADLRSVILRHSWDELLSGAIAGVARQVQTDAELTRITAVTSVLTGQDDMPSVHANAQRLLRAVPRCRLHRLPSCGHLAVLERPDLAAPLIQSCLQQEAPPGLRRAADG